MTAKEFEAQVKVGDRVVLREDLMSDHVYGGESYILPTPCTPRGMAKPGSTVTVSKIMIRGEKEKHPEFFVNDDTEWYYTPEMVDHVVREEKKNTVKPEKGMNKQEFLKRAKVGDTVVLRSDLIGDTKYGDDTYMVGQMLEPGSKGIISEIINQIDGKVFIFLKGDPDYWRYTPEMIARVISSDYSEREKVVELWIKKIGLEKARRFIDERLAEGDAIKMIDNITSARPTTDLWGCYYWKDSMLKAGRTAKIVCGCYNGADGKGRRYTLDKERRYCYSVPMFDTVYVGSRNEHIFNSIEKDLKTGTYVKEELVKTEPTEETLCSEEKVDKHLMYLRRKLADLKHEVEMVEGMIKRLSKNDE